MLQEENRNFSKIKKTFLKFFRNARLLVSFCLYKSSQNRNDACRGIVPLTPAKDFRLCHKTFALDFASLVLLFSSKNHTPTFIFFGQVFTKLIRKKTPPFTRGLKLIASEKCYKEKVKKNILII